MGVYFKFSFLIWREKRFFRRVIYFIRLLKRSNPEKKEQVNHKDGNKLNNSLENLEWMTNQENQIHKFKNGLGNNFTRKTVQYDLEMNKLNEFNSIKEAMDTLGVKTIQQVLNNKQKTAGGFIFKYLE